MKIVIWVIVAIILIAIAVREYRKLSAPPRRTDEAEEERYPNWPPPGPGAI